MNCEHCPIEDVDCIARLDPRYAHACAKAERGTPSDLAQIKALTARQGGKPAPPPPAYPSPARQLGNAVKAAARFVASGFARVDQAEHDRRKAICEACPSFDQPWNRCRKCGCALAVKPWSRAEKCPVGKWDDPAAGSA